MISSISLSNFIRFPMDETPSSFRRSCVRSSNSSPLISFSKKNYRQRKQKKDSLYFVFHILRPFNKPLVHTREGVKVVRCCFTRVFDFFSFQLPKSSHSPVRCIFVFHIQQRHDIQSTLAQVAPKSMQAGAPQCRVSNNKKMVSPRFFCAPSCSLEK